MSNTTTRAAGTAANPKGETLDGPDAGTGENPTPRYSPVCTFCYWWKPSDGRSCAAYRAKNSIPMAIWASQGAGSRPNGFNHLLPVAGDHGITFRLARGAKRPVWFAQSRKLANAAGGAKGGDNGKEGDASDASQ